jgi:nucleoside-diphosphate-sugar epimerase
MNNKILITGGTGFIASYLAMKLLEDDPAKEVVLFDSNPDMRRLTGFNNPAKRRYDAVKGRITFVQGDQSLLPHVLAVFEVAKPSTVYHLGYLLSAGAENNPTAGFQVDAVGTWNVLEAARLRHDCYQLEPLIKVMFPSTIASFGSFIAAGQKVKNEDVQMPTTVYGVSKVGSERLGEYYHKRTSVDFRAVRYPAVIGAARGPGGTTVYSTLMIQLPLQDPPKAYEVFVNKETRLDILYVRDAVNALIQLHDAPADQLKRRVYNIAGIRIADQAPQASDIEAAVKRRRPQAAITYNVDQQLADVVHTFGILDDSAARADWGWRGAAFDLDKAVKDFDDEVKAYPNRIKAPELG